MVWRHHRTTEDILVSPKVRHGTWSTETIEKFRRQLLGGMAFHGLYVGIHPGMSSTCWVVVISLLRSGRLLREANQY